MVGTLRYQAWYNCKNLIKYFEDNIKTVKGTVNRNNKATIDKSYKESRCI